MLYIYQKEVEIKVQLVVAYILNLFLCIFEIFLVYVVMGIIWWITLCLSMKYPWIPILGI